MDNEKSGLKEMLEEYQEMQSNIEDKQKKINSLKNALSEVNKKVDDLTNQLKAKFSNDEFVLVSVADLNSISNALEDAEGDISSATSEVSDLEYQQLSSVCSYIEDVGYTLNGASDNVQRAMNELSEIAEVEEEAEEAEEAEEKAPAKKAVKVVVRENDYI